MMTITLLRCGICIVFFPIYGLEATARTLNVMKSRYTSDGTKITSRYYTLLQNRSEIIRFQNIDQTTNKS